MFPKIPVLFYSGRHRLPIGMTGGYKQHSAQGIPIGLVCVIGFLIVLRPRGIGRLVRLRNGVQDLISPVLHCCLDLRWGKLLLVAGGLPIREILLKEYPFFSAHC